MFKEQFGLLSTLVQSDSKLVDAAGITVSPRTRMEIAFWPQVLQLRQQMLEMETAKWFPMLRKEYRRLKAEMQFYCEGCLSDFLNTVLEKLNSGEYTIKEPPKEVEK